MRILHLSHTDIRFDARVLKELSALSAGLNLKLRAIGVDDDEGAAAAQLPADVSVDVVRLLTRRWRRLPRAFRHALALIELVVRMLPKVVAYRPRIVHCHDTLVLPIGALARMMLGCSVVYDAHELESQKNGQSAALSRATLLIERMCWPTVDTLVSVSPSILEWYGRELGKRRSVLVMNSPAVQSTAVCTAVARHYFHERFGIPRSRKVFVYLGILCAGRGIPLLLEAFGRANFPADLVFVGYGDTIGVADAASRLPNVHLHPPVPHDQVVTLIRGADYGVCLIEDASLSDRYCLPNKLFEYAFSGLPVLASDLPEIRRVVNSHRLGLCCEADVNDVVFAIERLVAERWTVDVSSLVGLDWNSQATRLIEAYQDIVARRG